MPVLVPGIKPHIDRVEQVRIQKAISSVWHRITNAIIVENGLTDLSQTCEFAVGCSLMTYTVVPLKLLLFQET